jgi:hypothetical protein
MNEYIVFYQDGENDLSRTYQEVNAKSALDAQQQMLKWLTGVETIISVWEKVT